MKRHLEVLWRWDGVTGRTAFMAWAAALFLLKVLVDRAVLGWAGYPGWGVESYFTTIMPWPEGLAPETDAWRFVALLATAVPFLWAGCLLCVRRLRSAGLPLYLVVLFVVPVLKWFLFVALAILSGRAGERAGESNAESGPVHGTPPRGRGRPGIGRWLPESRLASAAASVGLSTLVALGTGILATEWQGNYGWALFVGSPFTMGFLAAALHSANGSRSIRDSLIVAELAVVLTGAGFLIFAFEGVICLLMAAPLAVAMAAVGGLAGHAVQSARRPMGTPTWGCAVPLVALPLMLGTEPFREGPPPLIPVTTSVEVEAPPERVWRHVVTFSELPPPTELMFRLGIAYPMRAVIEGSGVGVVRHCVFSTGPFVEPITTWDEPRLLAFSVTQNPAPMEEWTPYRSVHPPHLDGFLVSRRGQFRLIPLAGGGTRLEGTTWYHHTLWPAAYWRVWSDRIIHAIHRRVLGHVKALAEAAE